MHLLCKGKSALATFASNTQNDRYALISSENKAEKLVYYLDNQGVYRNFAPLYEQNYLIINRQTYDESVRDRLHPNSRFI